MSFNIYDNVRLRLGGIGIYRGEETSVNLREPA
jgi:hypothetical protein